MIHITAGSAKNIGTQSAIIIQVNAALTGTLTITSAGSTQYNTAAQTIAVVTDPGVSTLKYGGLHTYGDITITPSATTDITVTSVSRVS